MKPTVADVMQRQLCTVGADDTVEQIEGLFARHHLSWAPVADGNGQVIGVIAEADLVRFRVAAQDLSRVRAWQLCTYRPADVRSDAPVHAAAALMLARGIHHLLVTEHDHTVGVVSSLDLLRALTGGDG